MRHATVVVYTYIVMSRKEKKNPLCKSSVNTLARQRVPGGLVLGRI